MKIIEDKSYYKMSELVEQSSLSNHTISFKPYIFNRHTIEEFQKEN
jgi:hypothetical protein